MLESHRIKRVGIYVASYTSQRLSISEIDPCCLQFSDSRLRGGEVNWWSPIQTATGDRTRTQTQADKSSSICCLTDTPQPTVSLLGPCETQQMAPRVDNKTHFIWLSGAAVSTNKQNKTKTNERTMKLSCLNSTLQKEEGRGPKARPSNVNSFCERKIQLKKILLIGIWISIN